MEETRSQKYRRLHHDRCMISKWKSRGLLLREGETYQEIHDKVYSATNCELCNLSFDENNTPEMDHCHVTRYFRKVLCRSCNSKYLQLPRDKYKSNKSKRNFVLSKNLNGFIINDNIILKLS